MSTKTIQDVLNYLEHQNIHAEPASPEKFAIGNYPSNYQSVAWSSIGFKPNTSALPKGSEFMSLASMAAVEQLNIPENGNLLDICAAPGMKSLYALLSHSDLRVSANDLSENRLIRLKTLYKNHGVRAERITKIDGTLISKLYEPESFDRIILDAPCSGEGVILGDDPTMLEAWSPAKVKRLQQLQIKLLKEAWKLLKPDGRLVYATCTLNKNENERVIKKALHINISPSEITLSPNELAILAPGQARRILPSSHSIGFFYAVLDKSLVDES